MWCSPLAAVGIATLRSASQGHATREQDAAFARLAPHVLDAVRLRAMIEDKAAQFAVGALEAVSETAFLCDEAGRVLSMTRAAEALVTSGALMMWNGRLVTRRAADGDAIEPAVRSVVYTQNCAAHTVLVRDLDGRPMTIVAAALPRDAWSMAFHPRIFLTVKRHPGPPSAGRLQDAFGLTAAEAEIAIRIFQGVPRAQIAAGRSVSADTVKSQLKSIFSKLGVGRLYRFDGGHRSDLKPAMVPI